MRRLVIGLALLFVLVLVGFELALRYVPFPEDELSRFSISTIIQDRNEKQLRAYLSHDQRWRIPVKYDDISPWAIKATLAAEDKRFWSHSGVDYKAIFRAAAGNLTGSRIYSGASTISMQVAGFTIPSRERSYIRKFQQTFRAIQLERKWSKTRILEAYFTLAPYGGNVCGIEAASWRYFNCPSVKLTVAQAALLAGLPQSPERYRPDKNLGNAIRRQNYVLKRMINDEIISNSIYHNAVSTSLTIGINDLPVQAPHFCDYVFYLRQGEPIIRTSLDLDIQKLTEKIVRQKIAQLKVEGITNASVVVLDNKNREILAMIGSVDYYNKRDSGQVNGAMALRSPGSTLKPFIYAKALDSGLLSYDENLYDVPRQFGIYKPENYDKTFSGIIGGKKALALSLNLPAIDLIQRIGVIHTLTLLKDLGIETLNAPAGDYGLSLAIGTCRIRLTELTNAYATFPNKGYYAPWTVFPRTQAFHSSTRLLSDSGTKFVTEALSDAELRPYDQISTELSGLNNISWKTGTSNGFKDAWTIAYSSSYTVGVWVGNMNGKGSRGLIGSRAAAPIALSVLKQLGKNAPLQFLNNDTQTTTVCSITGLPVNDACKQVKAGIVQNSVVKLGRKCDVHKYVDVDVGTSLSLCTRCMINKSKVSQLVLDFPRAVENWIIINEPGKYTVPPQHNSECITARKGKPPQIQSPSAGSRFMILPDFPIEQQQIMLQAFGGTEKLFWFKDNEFLMETNPGEQKFIKPSLGNHKIKVVDEVGKFSTHNITVVQGEE